MDDNNNYDEYSIDDEESEPVNDMEVLDQSSLEREDEEMELYSGDEEEEMEIYTGDEDESIDVNDDDITDGWSEGVNESLSSAVPDQATINSLLRKCRNFISMIKRSTILTTYFDIERKKSNIKRNLCYDVKTRWNSTYHLIDSFLALRPVVERLFNSKHNLRIKQEKLDKLSDLELKSDDWTMLYHLHCVLRPFFHATTAMSGRNYPSVGFAYYLYTRLKNFLQNLSEDNVILKRLKQLLLKQLMHYFEADNDQ